MRAERLTAVDLFAGCGGLTEGLRRARFDVRAAVEIDPVAARTYRSNHSRTRVLVKDIRAVSSREIRRAARGGGVALVAGCAPCQGFCSLTSKWARKDPRNDLLLEMGRFVRALRPEVVLMENVPGVAERGKKVLEKFMCELNDLGYYPHFSILQMADFGVPQYRRRLVLLAGKGFVVPFPERTHSKFPERDGLRPWVSLREVIGGGRAPAKLSAVARNGGPGAANWHVVRDLAEQTKARLRAAMPGETWRNWDEALRPECHRNNYNGFTNVYGRMSWDKPSVTITAGCTTPCKGRFGHPDRRRSTISVREAALIQTFPERYVFATSFMDQACELVGNAVPPMFAATLGREIARALSAHRRVVER